MPVHALFEATAEAGRLEALVEAANRFVQAVSSREANARRAEAFNVTGSRTVIVFLSFEDALAAEEHRTKAHTERFTEVLDEAAESVDLHELEPC